MNENAKTYDNSEEFRKANWAMKDFQLRHNTIRIDYEILLEITEENKNTPEKFNSLYRAAIRSFLSLIESDMYGLNLIDPYTGYNDKNDFETKFKKTYKQICSTWKKEQIIKSYLDSKYSDLKNIKTIRDNLVHPKKNSDIPEVTEEMFNQLKKVFSDYSTMIHSIMDGFFIRINIDNMGDIGKLFIN
jgi:uncharacterized protein YutE (UPF0331/DUF86 family)